MRALLVVSHISLQLHNDNKLFLKKERGKAADRGTWRGVEKKGDEGMWEILEK